MLSREEVVRAEAAGGAEKREVMNARGDREAVGEGGTVEETVRRSVEIW